MSRSQLGTLLLIVGVAVLITSWGRVADFADAVLHGEHEVRPKKVVYWTSSGSPETDLKRAHQYEQLHPDTNIDPNFRETGGLKDILRMSFLSGNPPDYMSPTVYELHKYVLIGGLMPLDDLLAEEIERIVQDRIDARVEAFVAAYEADHGGAAPSADLLAARRAALAEAVRAELEPQGHRVYFNQWLEGPARGHWFRVNPDDRFLTEMERYPVEAARLLQMNGRMVGLRQVAKPRTLTYNRRLFREAAKMFPDADLVDEDGIAKPPVTWLEFYEKARVISEYGRRRAKELGRDEPLCYGLVIQGQRVRDLMRGLWALAQRAGSTQFAYAGDTETVHRYFEDPEVVAEYAGKPLGHFEYDHDAYLAAFALLFRMKQDGLILPGAEARHYEDVRTELASGNAAMLLDGWHAASIGCERVPWAAQDIGSAPVPRPYHEVDPDAGWPEEKVRAEREALDALLALDKVGVAVSSGNKMPQSPGEGVQVFTSLCRSPEATWDWIHFGSRNLEILKTECRRGMIRTDLKAMEHIGDPEWFPYPFQAQVYGVLEQHSQMWPEWPLHGPLGPPSEKEVFYKYFYQKDLVDLAEILPKARAELEVYNEAANEDFARRIEDGIVRPEMYTFPDWDPKNAEAFFCRQQNPDPDPEVRARLRAARERLVALARQHPEWGLLGPDGDLRRDLWRYEPPGTAWQVLWIPALMLAVIAGWFVWMALRGKRTGRPLLAEAAHGARRGWPAYLFVLPGMAAIFSFAIYPSLYQFYLSLHTGDGLGPMLYVGLQNFTRIFTEDTAFWAKVIPNTLFYIVFVAFMQVAIGLLLASLLNLPLRANRVYRVLFFIPLVTSLAIVSVILLGLLSGEDSALNEMLARFGLKDLPYWLGLVPREGQSIDWLGMKTGLFAVAGVGVWHGLPGRIILLLAGLQSISPELYDAAKVDGAGPWRRFWNVTIPEMLPILLVIMFMAFIGAARAFSVAFVLTEGGVEHSSELVATYIYKWGFMLPEGQEADLGYASALSITYSVLLAALTLANVIIIARRWRRRLVQEHQAGRPAAPGPARLPDPTTPKGGAA